jgi:hypothetical protein
VSRARRPASAPLHLVHTRPLPAPAATVGLLLDSLASAQDLLWPIPRWPPMRLDLPLRVGSHGGHGPLRYEVCEYQSGQLIRFRFDPRQFLGYHGFEVLAHDERHSTLRHVLHGQPRGWSALAWSALLEPLHHAAVEDSLDRADAHVRGVAWEPRALHGGTRVLYSLSRLAPR